MTDQFNESTVEAAALSWFEELGLRDRARPEQRSWRTRAERAYFGDVVFVDRICVGYI